MTGEETNNSLLIELKNISRSYGYGEAESFALKDFSLEVKKGEFIMIMGPSGCGKTTLLNLIGLLDKPTAGEYFLNGESIAQLSGHKKSLIRSRKIGYIFQNFNLIPSLPVIENVALPLVYSGSSKTRRLLAASEMLDTFHLQEREYYLPHQLSGGQQQRVCIARSLVNHPEIILADEPTGNLDSRSSHIVMEELRNIHSEGNTIIMVTHNPQLTTYATRVIHMLDGQIDADIKTVADEELYSSDDIFSDVTEDTPAIEIEETHEKYASDDITPEPEPIPESVVADEPVAPLGEISDERSFPIVGSEYIDKSVRAASKPSIEDMVSPVKSARRGAKSRTQTKSKSPKSRKGGRR